VSAARTPDPGAAVVSTPSLLVLAVTAFVVEVALFGGVGAVAHHAAGGGVRGWLAAGLATAVVLVLWGLFVAPKARRRLPAGARVVVSAVLCVATAAGLLWADHPVWGWFVGLAGLAVVAAQVVLPTHHDRPRSTTGRPTAT
jgi:Protein of unknown function (DUF2568)